jgi:TolB-like protein
VDVFGPSNIFLFEDFRLDRQGLFRREDSGAFAPVKIGSRALDILRLLVERADDLVSKEEIFAATWPNTVVEDGNLTTQISTLRRTLGPNGTEQTCIQTVAGRGYRFVGRVQRSETNLTGPASPPRLSIVVLPFASLSLDPEHEYFADAIIDDLTAGLSRITYSFVVARTTAFSYRGKAIDVREVARELGVHYVIEGSVRRQSDRVRWTRKTRQLVKVEPCP